MLRFLTCGLAMAVIAGSGVAHAADQPAPPFGPGDPPPTGRMTTCTMKGPSWVMYGVHDPNGPPRRGNRYQVNALGITCRKARRLLRAFFPKLPAHPMGKLRGGPAGYRCKGIDAPGTVTKNEMHDGSCRRDAPVAMFWWGPTGGKVG